MSLYKNQIGPEVALELFPRGAWHGIERHLKKAVRCRGKLPGGPILRPVRGQFAFYIIHGKGGLLTWLTSGGLNRSRFF